MIRIFLAAFCLSLGACTSAVTMKNPATGQIASCGPYVSTWDTAQREGQCIGDFQRQGFQRAAD